MAILQYGPNPSLPSLDPKRAELNDLFDAAVVNQLNDDNLLRQLFRRVPQVGNPYGFRVRTGRNPTAGTRLEPTAADPFVNADFGTQARLRVAEEAAIFHVGIAVTDYMLESSAGDGGIDVLLDEIAEAVMDFRDLEERNYFAIRSGTIAGEVASSMVGLRHVIQDATPVPTDTDTLYGTDRVANPILFSNAIYGATPGTPEAISQLKLDTGLRRGWEDGGRVNVLITKREQHDKINNLFSSQQRFMNETEIDGGFVLSTYRGIPIIMSVNASDTNGSTLVNDPVGPGDVFGLDMRHWELRVLKEARMEELARTGPHVRRFLQAFQQLICKKPNANFAIYDLN